MHSSQRPNFTYLFILLRISVFKYFVIFHKYAVNHSQTVRNRFLHDETEISKSYEIALFELSQRSAKTIDQRRFYCGGDRSNRKFRVLK